MKDKYQPKNFEDKWQKKWEEEKAYQIPNNQSLITNNKQYVLSMFPYPSGAGLHVGHVRIYTGTDVLARYFRMNGYQVLHPMGWDAFGLPAENAAIKAKKNPMDLVPKNIENFKRQMKMLGFSYDWEREFSTTDPEYYKWTQWLFIQFFKMGLLYKKEMPVYYCPFCKTGLAEEEVLPDGTHERCQKLITRKTLPQWVFRITKYADRLLEDLKGLDWPQGILEMQKNWIGKSEGAEIKFKLSVQDKEFRHHDFSTASPPQSGGSPKRLSQNQVALEREFITCFTTRLDTLYGVTALVVAPEHWLIEEIIKNNDYCHPEFISGSQKKMPKQVRHDIIIQKEKLDEIKKYVEEAKRKLDLARTDLTKEKTGVDTGLKAIHPLTNELIPIWVADYVLGWYGEGAVMVVPGHDERDFEFAKKFGLEIKTVIINSNLKSQNSCLAGRQAKLQLKTQNLKKAFTDYGILINSGEFDGLTSQEAIEKITEKLQTLNLGKKAVEYKLRDWIFSRQRYWGEPIPMVYCQKCGWQPIDEKDLPLKLPYIDSYEPTETGESPLSKISDWVNTKCPHCGGQAKRETDTMPNWAGSCWYFIRFAQNQKSKIKSQKLENQWKESLKEQNWLPVDWYLGGAEHAVLHLLYSRFWVKALYDQGLLDFKEPFLRLRNVGMVLAEDHRKMSKSFGNVINPDDVVEEYGADSLRLYEMFMAPFSFEIAWSTKALQGCYRFLKRVWEIYQNYKNQKSKIKNQIDNVKCKISESKDLVVKLQKTIKKVTEDIERIKLNTAVAAMMKFVNEWEEKIQNSNLNSQNDNSKFKIEKREIQVLSVANAKKFLQILAPFAPFLTEEIWREVFGEKTSIHLSAWPKIEEVEDEEVVIPVQVNGKVRGTIEVERRTCNMKREIEKIALENEKVKKYLHGKKYKMIYIEGKIVNFIII